MSEIAIMHDECMGFDANFGISFIDDNMFCIRSGNFLQICQFKDRALDILSQINGELTGFSSMAGSPYAHILAYADQIQNPMIHLIDPNGKELGTVSMNGTLGVKSMDFSFDGKWLYALGGLPTFRLSAFNWESREEVTSQTFDSPIGKYISCCPTNPRLFAVYGDEELEVPSLPEELQDESPPHLRFFTLQGCKDQYAFVEVISKVDAPVTAIAWTPNNELAVATNDGRIVFVDPHTGDLVGDVFHSDSLDDGKQVMTALYCTSHFVIASGTSGNIYWLNLGSITNTSDIFILEADTCVRFFKIFPRSNRLMFGSTKNVLVCVDLDEKTHQTVDNSMTCLRETHQGPITSVATLPHQIVTAGADGTLRFWSCSPYLAQMQKIQFANESLSCIAASKGGLLVAVGSQSGVVRIISTANPENPVLLFRERLHEGAVTSITITDEFIASGSTSGSVVILRADPCACFPLIGLLQLHTSVISIASPPPLNTVQQLLIATSHREIIRIDLPEMPGDNFKLPIESLNRALLKISNKCSMIVAEPTLREEQQYFFCACDDKSVKYYCMPITTGDLDIVGVDDVECSSPDDVLIGHAKGATAIALSPQQQFVASGCAGATLIVRELDVATAQVKRTMMTVTHHSPTEGAISGVAFSPDGHKLFTVGYDGCINSYTLRIEPCALQRDGFTIPTEGTFKNSVSRQFEIDHQIRSLAEMWQSREYDSSEENGFQADDGSGIEELPLATQIRREKGKQQQVEINEFQTRIMEQLNAIRDEFMDLVNKNEDAPELEKLTKTDFTLDTAAADRLQHLATVRQALVHYRRRVKNQIRSLACETIKGKAFEPFEPKLTTLYSFKTPIEFDNFPLPVMDAKAKRRLQCVTLLRRTEIASLRYKAPAGSNMLLSQLRDSALDGSRYLYSRTNSLVQITMSEQSDNDLIVKEEERLLYDPFQLMTGNRKITQITIVQHLILEAMSKFNIVFDDMMSKKINAVQSLEEKNKRIRQLIRLLKLNADDYELFDPPVYHNENPESFLEVRDEEVVLKKVREEGDQQQEKSDELEKDSFAERALRAMMGGNVNMNNIEEAPNDDEPIAPEWMSTKKKEEMTEEEQYQVQEFEKKKKIFFEEREKRKKMLSAELTKLYKSCGSTIEEFDQQMCAAYMQRFDTEERVYYHELEIMQLIAALDSERKLRHELNAISDEAILKHEVYRQKSPALTELSAEAANASKAAATAEENLESLKGQVQKDFKNRDALPQLMKWYNYSVAKRVRPKVSSGPNTFQQFLGPSIEFTSAMEEILNPANRPASLPEQSWKTFLEYCETKMRASREAAERQAEASELKAREAAFQREMEDVQSRFTELENEQSEKTGSLLNTLIDMHVPFTFRQGQVEIPSDEVLVDYSDVVLIDKNVVIGRNQLIIEAGQKKLAELENIRRQRSEHKELKWKIAKANVDLKNLKEEIQEYQLFRVTKYDQELIRSRLLKNQNGEQSKQNNELKSLQDGLDHMLKQHVTRMERAEQTVKKLEKKLEKKRAENERIKKETSQMQLSLKERKRIYNIQMKSSEGAQEARKRRLKQVMMIAKLKRARQVQEAKIADMKAEVARLRRCVYTSFGDDGNEEDMMVGYKS